MSANELPISIPEELLAQLPDDARSAAAVGDCAAVARAVLTHVDSLPPFSSMVRERSQWLAIAQQLIAQLEDASLRLDVPLLAAIAQTAFAARETAPALTACEQALAAAVSLENSALEAVLIARRLPHLASRQQAQASHDKKRLLQLMQMPDGLSDSVRAECALALLAHAGLARDFDEQRSRLVSLARLALPKDERLTFVAYASQCSLAQMSLRKQERLQAVKSLIEAARLTAQMQAFAELSNLQAMLAAFAVRSGDFAAAVAHAGSSLDAARQATNSCQQSDPWLGLPFDVSIESDCGGMIRNMAEAAIAAIDRGDQVGFLVLVTALVAFYILDDRAPEALDALNESIETAQQFEAGRGVNMLRKVSESLLRHMGMLT